MTAQTRRTEDFQKSARGVGKLTGARKFEIRAARTGRCFRTIEGLQQKAGVPKNRLRRLVLKELADNGARRRAPASASASIAGGGYFVEDDGRGHRRHAGGDRAAVQHRPADDLDQAAAAADPRRARQRSARRRRRGAGLGGHARRHHPQPPDRASPRARRHDHRRQRDAGQVPDRHPHRDQLRPGAAGRPARACTGRRLRVDMAQGDRPTRASRRRGGTTPPQFHELLSRAATRRCAN